VLVIHISVLVAIRCIIPNLAVTGYRLIFIYNNSQSLYKKTIAYCKVLILAIVLPENQCSYYYNESDIFLFLIVFLPTYIIANIYTKFAQRVFMSVICDKSINQSINQ